MNTLFEELPQIGYGTFPRKDELIECIPTAYQVGFRLYDTSDDYSNISYIGMAFDSLPNDVVIQTKISNWGYGPTRIEEEFQKMKKCLGNQYLNRPIDVLLLHFPYPFIMIDTWRELEKLYKKGEVKYIGVCNFKVKHLKKLLKKCEIKPMINQIEIHPLFQQKDITEFCMKNNILIQSYSPFARMDKELIQNDTLVRLATSKKTTVTSIIIRWNYQHGYVALPSSKSADHMSDNFSYQSFCLNDAEMTEIDNLDMGKRIRYDPDMMFSKNDLKKYFKWHLKYKLKMILKNGRSNGS